MYYTVDRIENGIAVVIGDDGKAFDFPEKFFFFKLHEGDVLLGEINSDGLPLRLIPDGEETARRRSQVHSLFEKLKQKGDNQQ